MKMRFELSLAGRVAVLAPPRRPASETQLSWDSFITSSAWRSPLLNWGFHNKSPGQTVSKVLCSFLLLSQCLQMYNNNNMAKPRGIKYVQTILHYLCCTELIISGAVFRLCDLSCFYYLSEQKRTTFSINIKHFKISSWFIDCTFGSITWWSF